jgi:hypothetical protein
MTKKPYVNSGYERIKDDDYKTIDPRCIQALDESFNLHGKIVDCCAPTGSGIVNELLRLGHKAFGYPDAFQDDIDAMFIVTNPPYAKNIVDKILWRQIKRIEDGEVFGFAALLRNNFDFAKKRKSLFPENPFYFGEIKMCFRPIWIEPIPGEKKVAPIHNFSWYIWSKETLDDKVVRHWYEK